MEESEKLSQQEIEQCLAVLQKLNADTNQIFEIPKEQRIALIRAAGEFSRPDKEELSKRQKEGKSSTSSASHSASMNSPVNACIESGEKQMSWCWIEDVLDRMLRQTSKPDVESNAKKIENIIRANKAERYVVSVNSLGEAKIIGL